MNGPDWTYWLQMMNLAMVAVVVLAGITVVIPAFWELGERRRRLARRTLGVDQELRAMLRAEPHRISIPELGLTMADGGEELKTSDHDSTDKRARG
ncbi:MAG: hypothetical protein WCD47_14935 [Candidatus Sulfotelmatobacter sp.]